MQWQYMDVASTDPTFNLALEQYVFDCLPRDRNYFLLWQNKNAVIIGRHQNTLAEINGPYIKEKGIQVVRRLSGGGAVYHDMGNLNFTFIQNAENGIHLDLGLFCQPVAAAIRALGADAQVNGRNDITLDGQKFSGNAQYVKEGRVMHHGTLLFASDMQAASDALRPDPEKIKAKGVQSVRSHITNLQPHLPGVTLEDFKAKLLEKLFEGRPMEPYTLTEADLAAIEKLQKERYSTWDWNYGSSPPCDLIRKKRIEGCGTVEVRLSVKDGRIREAVFFGDFFSAWDPKELAERLIGLRPVREDLEKALEAVEIPQYFTNLSKEDFLAILEN